MKIFLSIFLIILTLQSNIYAIDKKSEKVKFHLPETDAERALDKILKLENDTNQNNKYNNCLNLLDENCEELFTKNFIIAIQKKEDAICNKEDKDDPCLLSDPILCGNSGGDDQGYLYYTIKQTNEKVLIGYEWISIVLNKNKNINQNEMWNLHWKYRKTRKLFDEKYNYILKKGYIGLFNIHKPILMKKENGKWKIDEINCFDK